jgi:hypothetical protein
LTKHCRQSKKVNTKVGTKIGLKMLWSGSFILRHASINSNLRKPRVAFIMHQTLSLTL